MSDSGNSMAPSTKTVLILFFCFVGLVLLLIFLYKKLNKEAHGEYTIRRMIYKEGGIRDRVRGAVLALGTHLRVQLWPGGDTDEERKEMQEIPDVERRAECKEGSQESDMDGDEDQDEDEEKLKWGDSGKGDDTSEDGPSSMSSEAEEQAKLMDKPKPKDKKQEKGEEKQENVGEELRKVGAKGGAELLIDLKQFSGSAIWSEEEGVAVSSDVTVL